MSEKTTGTTQRWVIALTGATGMKYALRMLDVLSDLEDTEVHVVISEAASRVLREEEDISFSYREMSAKALIGRDNSRMAFYHPADIGATIASGSLQTAGMVIVPCSMGTMAGVAHGMSDNLITRAADVTLKEGRRLIIVPRETPMSVIQIENMLTLARAGVRIVPAMPGFYHRPKSIDDLIDMMVMKVLDQMGIHIDLVPRWASRC